MVTQIEMRLLIDTDAFCKLGAGGLLAEAIELLGASTEDCGRLPALPHMLRRGKLYKLFGAEVCEALLPIAEAMPLIGAASEQWLDQLTAVQGIDLGEAQLFAFAAERGALILSGDKRALRALKTLPTFVASLAGRIVAVETILIALCNHLGVEEVRQRITRLATVDTAIKICFSARIPDPREALQSYRASLTEELAPMELWTP